MMRNIVFLLASFYFVSCGSNNTEEKEPKFAVLSEWKAGPSVAQSTPLEDYIYSKVEITLLTKDKKAPKSVELIQVKPWMKIHGHGSPSTPKVREIYANVFEVSNIHFNMSGPWELQVSAIVDGVRDTVEVNVEVP